MKEAEAAAEKFLKLGVRFAGPWARLVALSPVQEAFELFRVEWGFLAGKPLKVKLLAGDLRAAQGGGGSFPDSMAQLFKADLFSRLVNPCWSILVMTQKGQQVNLLLPGPLGN